MSVFLLTEAGWDQATIGAVLTASGLVGITMHTPMGMIIDVTREKRALLIGGVDTLLPLVLTDITRGTGRYNVSRGLVSTVQGIGGSLSHAVAGTVVVSAGYEWAFLGLASIALVALLLVAIAMPETGPER